MEFGKQYKIALFDGTTYLANVEAVSHLDEGDVLVHDGTGKTIFGKIAYIADEKHIWRVTGNRISDMEELNSTEINALVKAHISTSPVHMDHISGESTELIELRTEVASLRGEITEVGKALSGLPISGNGIASRVEQLRADKDSIQTRVFDLEAQIVDLKKKPVKEVKQNERKGVAESPTK